MSNLQAVKINSTAIAIKEYKSQRVVTLKEIDLVHGRPDGTAKRNFNENQKRLVDGVDYFHLSYDEVRRTNFVQRPNSQGLILIAQSGYLMLVKSFTDDLAWDVQRQLVNTYFNAQDAAAGKPTAYHEALAEAKLRNSRAREASIWLKLSQQVAMPEYKQVCASYASSVLAGSPVIPLPLSGERHLSAKEVGEILGISANKVGSIANREGLKTQQYGKWYHDKSPYSAKEVDTFKYNMAGVEKLRQFV